jgi:hypothetical protein
MSQATTAIADGTGAQVLAELTSAFSAAQSWQFGSTDPYTAGYNVNAGTWWMDQGNMLVKQRNITNDAWINKGIVNADGTVYWYSDEFLENQLTITCVSPTSFTVPGDLTGVFTANRKVKIYLSSSTAISYVVSSAYNTVTTVTLGSAVLNPTVTAVKYSIIQNGEPQNTVHTADLSPYAPLASPVFTGTPTAPTAAKGDSSTKLATTEFVTAAAGAHAPVSGNAGSHNALFRGKDLTSYFDSGAMSTAISNGTFDDIYPGDYIVKSITVNGTTKTYNIVIGDCDYHLHRGDTETTAHHVLAFTRVHIGNEHMNATDTTAGGYIGSDMWKTILPKYTTAIKNAFGSSHILTHRELLSNAESDTVSSAAGAGWSGGTTGWDWYDVDVNLFNEPMVYGCHPFSSSGFDIGDCDTQVAAMRHDKSLSFTRTYWYWLRAVVSSSYFAVANGRGCAACSSASAGDGGVRVYFLLK